MIRRLKLENFKSFKKAELELGNFTLLIGANASGKSNIRDAFRFLHGVGRGYTLGDILGEKWGEGGSKQWAGIRGGSKEIIFNGASSFSFTVNIGTEDSDHIGYHVALERETFDELQLVRESLSSFKNIYSTRSEMFGFSTHPYGKSATIGSKKTKGESTRRVLSAHTKNPFREPKRKQREVREFRINQSILSQIGQMDGLMMGTSICATALSLQLFEFFDFDPDSLRKNSLPGQHRLGYRGDNLPSVLRHICKDEKVKEQLTQWISELTPMEIESFNFKDDLNGKINLMFKDAAREKEFHAEIASDGTLRFLGMLAALFQPNPEFQSMDSKISSILFIEEIDTGIHPAKLHLLIQLIESVTRNTGIQVVATTHSPQALDLLNDDSFKHAYLTYKPKGAPDTRLQRITDIPDIHRLRKKYDMGRLHYSGWFENAMNLFNEGDFK